MTKNKTIVIVGSGHCALHVAASARASNESARIILVNDSLCADVHESFANKGFGTRYSIERQQVSRVDVLDSDARCLLVNVDGVSERMPFDSLVFVGAPRSKTDASFFHNQSVDCFFSLKKKIAQGIVKKNAKHAVVLDCGFYGVQAAQLLMQAGYSVSIVDEKKRIMPEYSWPVVQAMLTELINLGVSVTLGQRVQQWVEADEQVVITLTNGKIINADLAVACALGQPDVSLLANAGAALDVDGTVRVDDAMATTISQVFACGTSVKIPLLITGERKWITQPSAQIKAAQIAGHNAACEPNHREKLSPCADTMIAVIGKKQFARTGLTQIEARKHFGDENLLITTAFGRHDEPSSSCVRLIIDKGGKRVVGGEIFGTTSVEARIANLAAAVLDGYSPEKLLDVDITYLDSADHWLDPLKDAALRAKVSLSKNFPIISADQFALWLQHNRDFRLIEVSDVPLTSSKTVKSIVRLSLEALRDQALVIRDNNMPIVLYDEGGEQSHLAQRVLVSQGFANVYELEGGLTTINMLLELVS